MNCRHETTVRISGTRDLWRCTRCGVLLKDNTTELPVKDNTTELAQERVLASMEQLDRAVALLADKGLVAPENAQRLREATERMRESARRLAEVTEAAGEATEGTSEARGRVARYLEARKARKARERATGGFPRRVP